MREQCKYPENSRMNGIWGTYRGDKCLYFGIKDIPDNIKELEKDIIQQASGYIAGMRYDEKPDNVVFYSGEYHLEMFTEELNDMEVEMYRSQYKWDADRRNWRAIVRKHHKKVYAKVLEYNSSK